MSWPDSSSRAPAIQVLAEQGATFTRCRRVERLTMANGGIRLEHRLEQENPGGIRHEHRAPRTEQWRVGKPGRWMLEELATGSRQCPHRRVAVALEEHRRRPPGGMQSGLLFPFEQQHPTTRREFGGNGRTGHARAQHDDVCVLQGNTVGDASGIGRQRYLGRCPPANHLTSPAGISFRRSTGSDAGPRRR